MTFHLTITTPEEVLVDDEVEKIVVPTTSGELTILPGHTTLVSALSDGTVVITKHGQSEDMVIMGGFLQVDQKNVSILAHYGILGKNVVLIEVEEAKKRAEKAMQEHTSREDFAVAEAAFKKAVLELKVGRKQKTVR